MKKSLLIKPFLTKSYPAASYGSGIYIYDTEGKRYIDGSSGAVTASIGHGIPDIIGKMEEQSKKYLLYTALNLQTLQQNCWLIK